ncbi:hypothetical protein [Glycocaulis sp.]|uniref:hypothetical protein n=1 Tax=Glycocaulis sp. TaxID=1969725 RepID=UPI003D1FBE8D
MSAKLIPACLAALLMSCATTDPGVYSGGARGLFDPHSGNNLQDLPDCSEIYDGGAYLVASPVAGRPGSQIELRHNLGMGHTVYNIPLRCVDQWRIDPPEAATLSANRRFLDISPDAAPGDVTLTATARGYSTSITIPVIDSGVPNLYGSWIPAQRYSCAQEEMPSVISIRPDGRVLMGFPGMMGQYQDDYRYSYDPETGAFTLGQQTGQVRVVEDGHIIFTGIAFPGGQPPPPLPPGYPPRPDQDSCEFEFRRTGELY